MEETKYEVDYAAIYNAYESKKDGYDAAKFVTGLTAFEGPEKDNLIKRLVGGFARKPFGEEFLFQVVLNHKDDKEWLNSYVPFETMKLPWRAAVIILTAFPALADRVFSSFLRPRILRNKDGTACLLPNMSYGEFSENFGLMKKTFQDLSLGEDFITNHFKLLYRSLLLAAIQRRRDDLLLGLKDKFIALLGIAEEENDTLINGDICEALHLYYAETSGIVSRRRLEHAHRDVALHTLYVLVNDLHWKFGEGTISAEDIQYLDDCGVLMDKLYTRASDMKGNLIKVFVKKIVEALPPAVSETSAPASVTETAAASPSSGYAFTSMEDIYKLITMLQTVKVPAPPEVKK